MADDTIYAGDTIYSKQGPAFLLWACRETGVIEALIDGPTDPGTLAAETGITNRAAEITTDALLQMGFVEQAGSEFRPTERLEVFDPARPITERGILPHRLDSLEKYMRLPEAMRTGEYPDLTEAELQNYVGGMVSLDESAVRAGVTVAEHAHPRPGRVLDVGGGYGRFGREFAARGADVTLLDRPGVIDIVRAHGADGIVLVPGDARESLPDGFDLAFCARVIMRCSPDEARQVFRNVYEALEPGGTVVCLDYIRGLSAAAEMFSVHTMAMVETGRTHTREEYRSWLEETGFTDPAVVNVPSTDFHAAIARKPE